jgi:hypothetical protein
MGELDKDQTFTLTELMVSTLAMIDAITKILVEKGIMSEAEFREHMAKERATYQALISKVQ